MPFAEVFDGQEEKERSDRRTGDAECRTTQLAEDQDVVQDDIREYHYDRVRGKDTGVGRADVKGAEQDGREREEEAVDAPVEIADRSGVNGIRID